MAILTKPSNSAFVIDASKLSAFLQASKDSKAHERRMKRCAAVAAGVVVNVPIKQEAKHNGENR